MFTSLIRISISVALGLLMVIALQLGYKAGEKRLLKVDVSRERLNRLKTLLQAGRSIGQVITILVISLMILHEVGVNIAPVLASAGVVGLALSLGSQTIIKDYLGGIVILVENQFAVGDVLSINTMSGTVERVTLRATYLRDIEGKLHLIPNGDIRAVSNLTSHWSQAVVTLNVDYDADMGRVLHALEEAALMVKSDPQTTEAILDAPKAFGWTGFTDWAVQVQMIVRTKPGMQWSIGRALRKAALEQFHKESIRVALPIQRTENVQLTDDKSQQAG